MAISLLGHKSRHDNPCLSPDADEFTLWKSELERLYSQFEVRHYRTDPNPAEANIVLAWKAPHGAYKVYTSARLIHSLGRALIIYWPILSYRLRQLSAAWLTQC